MSLRGVIITFTLAFLFQQSLLELFAVGGHTPHLILCLGFGIVFYFHEGYRAIPWAVGAMLLSDICSARFVGVGALSLFLTFAVVMLLRYELNTERWQPTLAAGLASSLCYTIIYFILMRLLGDPMHLMYYLGQTLPVIFYDGAVVMIIYGIFRLRGVEPENEEPVDIALAEQDPLMTFEEAARSLGIEPPPVTEE